MRNDRFYIVTNPKKIIRIFLRLRSKFSYRDEAIYPSLDTDEYTPWVKCPDCPLDDISLRKTA